MRPKPRTVATVFFVATAAFATALAPTVRAATADVERAATLKHQGDDLMDELKYADAYAVYVQAYALTADSALLYNEGRALEAMGDYPEALAKFEQFAKVAPPDIRALVPGLDTLIADVRSRVSTLVVVCNVRGARVVVRSKQLGQVEEGEHAFALRAGPAEVEVQADGYQPFRQKIDLPGGATSRIEAMLFSELAVVTIASAPTGSLIVIDDHAVGPTPLDAKLVPGAHTIVVRREGYVEQRFPVSVQAGERRNLDVTLHPTPPITARWWFWASVATVVVAGAVVTTALLVDKPVSSGTFSPGQVRAPLTIQF